MSTLASPKRLILFAGYCAGSDGISPQDVALITELARFGDVHCWYDNTSVPIGSLARLGRAATSVTVQRHGEYDFGSWKYLYLSLGRDFIEGYDELVLTNNSLLIVDSFERLFHFRSERPEEFFSPLLVDEDFAGPTCFIEDYELAFDKFTRSAMYVSAFWNLRRNLVRSSLFRNFICSIQKVQDRIEVSHRYERGFSRSLWRHGISTCTLLPRVYRFVPLYTEDAFMLTQQGLPFIKYKALSQEYYRCQDIVHRYRSLLGTCQPAYRSLIQNAITKHDHMGRSFR